MNFKEFLQESAHSFDKKSFTEALEKVLGKHYNFDIVEIDSKSVWFKFLCLDKDWKTKTKSVADGAMKELGISNYKISDMQVEMPASRGGHPKAFAEIKL